LILFPIFIICVLDASQLTPELVGECGFVAKDYPNLFLPDRLWQIVFKQKSKINAQWLNYLLNTNKFKCQIKNTATGTSNSMKNIAKDTFLEIQIPLPPLPEQKAIARVLSDVDDLIRECDSLLATKRDIKQGTMQQLLTGKKRLPGFSGEWEEKKLGDITNIDVDNLKSNTNRNYSFKYISLEDVERGKLKSISECVFASAPSRARRKVKINDVLVATVRPNLQSHLFIKNDVQNLVCSTGFSVIRCDPDITNAKFIYHHFFANIIETQFNTLLVGSNYPAVNSSDIKNLKLPIPTLPEQKAIAEILSDMDAEIEALEQKRDKYKAIKQGMMQELLTGKTRIKGLAR
jgi:type I restriction enzyme S subunit